MHPPGMEDSDRRVRKLAALLEMGLTPVDVPPVTCEAFRVSNRKYKVISIRPAMGTLVSITAIHPSRDVTEEAAGRVFEEIDRLVGILSRHDQSTALAYLNKEGFLEGVPRELHRVVSGAFRFHSISGGAFDISVKPVIDLLESSVRDGGNAEPAPEGLRGALELTGSDHIELTENAIGFKKRGMGVTLDGIAKGYIVDRAAEILAGYKIRNFLINAGGDIRISGKREDRQPWTVAVQDPAGSGEFPDVIMLTKGAVATSAGYKIHYDPEMKFHHIVDSATGRSPHLNASVSVVAPTAMAADALATTLFLMETEKGIELIETLPGCESLIVGKTGEVVRTKGWKSASR